PLSPRLPNYREKYSPPPRLNVNQRVVARPQADPKSPKSPAKGRALSPLGPEDPKTSNWRRSWCINFAALGSWGGDNTVNGQAFMKSPVGVRRCRATARRSQAAPRSSFRNVGRP